MAVLVAACGGQTNTATDAGTVTTDAGSECQSPNDCPDPGSECIARICLNHQCGTMYVAYGTPTVAQSDGDCSESICDGKGGKTSVADDADILTDNKQCTVDYCQNGELKHDPAIAGTLCAENGGDRCDNAGACVECLKDEHCAGDSICSNGACVEQTCTDTIKNGTETDTDCGGSRCGRCEVTGHCDVNADCKSGLCALGICATTEPVITSVSATGHDRFFNVAFDAQGNIFAVGVSAAGTDAASDYSTIVAKFTPQGVLDHSFGADGVFTQNITTGANGELARGIGFQSTGKIIVSATVDHIGGDPKDRDVAILRLNTDGTLDTTFAANGVAIIDLSDGVLVGSTFLADSVWHLAVQPDDKIVFHGSQVRPGGTDTDYALVRLEADGSLDTTFNGTGKVLVDIRNQNASARSLTLLPDGSIMGAGYMDEGGVGSPVVYKVKSNGTMDTTFGSGGVYNAVVLEAQTEAYAVAFQGAKFVTTGYGRANAMTESVDWTSLRFLANGTLDTTYGTNGVARVDYAGYSDQSRDLIVLPDNRVLLVGGARPTANNVDGAVALLTPNGQPDQSFSSTGTKYLDLGGANDFLWSAKLSPSKKYVVFAGIKGVASGGAGNDDTALVLMPIGE